ncbi:MAG TPA: biotin--[acetyl-CoA-carboxylase] ligase [Actinomycetota bacterium]|nr:biotin--[acetyl-CoA-carboxylase] ligase [Actinomycetota bacterium]
MATDLSAAEIETALRGSLGRPLRLFDVVGSTNDVALDWARAGAPHGALVVADHQSAGRGRRGRAWLSEPGRALQASLVLRPPVPPPDAALLTTLLGVACAGALAGAAELDAAIEWPNDVTVGGRKVAGILVESRTGGDGLVAVAGVGINVDWPSGALPREIASRATSVAAERARAGLGPPPTRPVLLAALLHEIERLLPSLAAADGRAALVARASERSTLLGRRVRVRLASGAALDGVARRLLPSGALEIATDDGPVAVDAGEVERARGGQPPEHD